MNQLIFDEKTFIDGNIFKYEQRLNTAWNKYTENGALLVRYWAQRENSITVDRGIQDIDQIFGNKSPLRFTRINNFPIHGFGQANPDNSDELQIEDINVEGECVILPSTITPKPMDFFMINHLKMTAIFQVTNVTYDTMKAEGFYTIKYRLISTSEETLQNLEKQTEERCEMDLNAIGTKLNPIIREDLFFYREQVDQMVDKMIESYIALYYNRTHNCFLYHDKESGLDWFDLCGNEFIAKHGLMNSPNSTDVIILNDKIKDRNLPLYYNDSVYNWLEIGAPNRLLQKFFFILLYAEGYPYSSFVQWGDGDIQIMTPVNVNQVKKNFKYYSIFDEDQFRSFLDDKVEPVSSEYDKLIWKYINKTSNLNIKDVSLYIADALLSSVKNIDTFIYTPIVIYIIKQIMKMN